MSSSAVAIACSEVWGDNRAVDAELLMPGLRSWVYARPYQGAPAGGDVHYVSSCGTGRIARLLLADVAGHGRDAAAIGSKLRRLMQRYMNHIDPGQLAAQLNRDIGEAVEDTGRFVTAIVVTYFSPDGGLSLCNAGHPPPMLFRSRTRRWSLIDQPDTQEAIVNLPLGILDSSGYQGRELTLEQDDMVLLYTDCLIEARPPEAMQDTHPRAMLEVSGLLEVLNRLSDQMPPAPSPRQVIEQLLGRIESLGYRLDDDLTAVVLLSTGPSRGASMRGKLAGGWRLLRDLPRMLAGAASIPWPELSIDNLWGGLHPGHRRKRSRMHGPSQRA